MTEQQALALIAKQRRFHETSSLQWMQLFLDRLGNPQKSWKAVHIAGTNGKGSTSTMLACVLERAGYRTGKFISPYVLEFRERIQIDHEMIPSEELVALVEEIEPVVRQLESEGVEITEFEFVTAIAFTWFQQQECDIVVLETGVGGRYDSTNVISQPLVSVITSLSLDHTGLLGHSLAEIAWQKAGILKPGGTTIVAPGQPKEALSVLVQAAKEQKNRLLLADLSSVQVLSESLGGMQVQAGPLQFFLPLAGPHQVGNLATALAVLEELQRQGWRISNQEMQEGLSEARLPARLEVLGELPVVVLDGAHNPAGIAALQECLARYLNGCPLVGIMGVMQDKEVAGIIEQLYGVFSAMLTVTPTNPRAMDARELAQMWYGKCPYVEPFGSDFAKALGLAKELAGKQGAVVIFGSLFLAADFRRFALESGKNFCPETILPPGDTL